MVRGVPGRVCHAAGEIELADGAAQDTPSGWVRHDVIIIGAAYGEFGSVSGGDAAVDVQSFSDLRALRVLRALRLIKLVKILTAFRVFRRWEIKVAVNYAALSLGKCMVGMLVLAHWFAWCVGRIPTRAPYPNFEP